jgi:antitoxin component of RelBE/YafQ-DinJ toxin-antitoxin module
MKRNRIDMRIDGDLKERAEEIARQEHTNLSEVIRAYLKRYVAAKRKEQ